MVVNQDSLAEILPLIRAVKVAQSALRASKSEHRALRNARRLVIETAVGHDPEVRALARRTIELATDADMAERALVDFARRLPELPEIR